METAKLFMSGNNQAVRLPLSYRSQLQWRDRDTCDRLFALLNLPTHKLFKLLVTPTGIVIGYN